MSRTVYEGAALSVVQIVGPATPDPRDRRLWEVTVRDDDGMTIAQTRLGLPNLRALAACLADELERVAG
jgi:hypothetical protein